MNTRYNENTPKPCGFFFCHWGFYFNEILSRDPFRSWKFFFFLWHTSNASNSVLCSDTSPIIHTFPFSSSLSFLSALLFKIEDILRGFVYFSTTRKYWQPIRQKKILLWRFFSTYHIIPSFQLCFITTITLPVSWHFMFWVGVRSICFPSYWRINWTDFRSSSWPTLVFSPLPLIAPTWQPSMFWRGQPISAIQNICHEFCVGKS